jgi:hypothetical protein
MSYCLMTDILFPDLMGTRQKLENRYKNLYTPAEDYLRTATHNIEWTKQELRLADALMIMLIHRAKLRAKILGRTDDLNVAAAYIRQSCRIPSGVKIRSDVGNVVVPKVPFHEANIFPFSKFESETYRLYVTFKQPLLMNPMSAEEFNNIVNTNKTILIGQMRRIISEFRVHGFDPFTGKQMRFHACYVAFCSTILEIVIRNPSQTRNYWNLITWLGLQNRALNGYDLTETLDELYVMEIVGSQQIMSVSQTSGDSESGVELCYECELLAPELGSRKGLSEPHLYFFAKGASFSKHPKSSRLTDLEKMYETAKGYMIPLAEKNTIKVRFPSGHGLLYVIVFYKVDERSAGYMVGDSYTVTSHGFHAFSSENDLRGPFVMTTTAGPMNQSYIVDRDSNIKKPFRRIADMFIKFNGAVVADKKDTIESAENQRLLDSTEERIVSKYIETLFDAVKQARTPITSAQNLVYQGFPEILPLTFAAYLPPTNDAPAFFLKLRERACKRNQTTPAAMDSMLREAISGHMDTQRFIELRRLVIDCVNTCHYNTYVDDKLFGEDVDYHQSVRLTNEGDCDDPSFAIMQTVRQLQRDKTILPALSEFLCQYHAALGNMYVDYPNSPQHAVCMLLPVNSNLLPILLEGTSPNYNDFYETDEPHWEAYGRVVQQLKKSTKRMFACSPAPSSTSGFYVGCVAAAYWDRAKNQAVYARFVKDTQHTLADMTESGVPFVDVFMKGKYHLVEVPASPDVHSILSKLADKVSIPVPMATGLEKVDADLVADIDPISRTWKGSIYNPNVNRQTLHAHSVVVNLHRPKTDLAKIKETIMDVLRSNPDIHDIEAETFSIYPKTSFLEIQLFLKVEQKQL